MRQVECQETSTNYTRLDGILRRSRKHAPSKPLPSRIRLAGSGTGVKLCVVMKFVLAPAFKTMVMSWESEYGVVVSEVRAVTCVSSSEVGGKVFTGDVRVAAGVTQKEVEFELSIQLFSLTLPSPLASVNPKLLMYRIFGGVVGVLKNWSVR